MPIGPRPSPGASGSVLRLAPPARTSPRLAPPSAAPSPASPAVRVLVAGVDKDERAAVEAAVRRGLGARAADGPWSVSVVQMAGKWSVTLDGGGLRSASAVAERTALADAVRSLVGDARPAPPEGAAASVGPSTAAPPRAPGPAATPRAEGEVRDRHECAQCGRGLLVVYEARVDEAMELAPVACPHCWAIGQVEVGAWAAAGRDYRSEKA